MCEYVGASVEMGGVRMFMCVSVCGCLWECGGVSLGVCVGVWVCGEQGVLAHTRLRLQ